MPRTILSEITKVGWAFCPAGACPGYRMEEVQAVYREVGDTFQANGGDIPGVERSQVELLFADESDVACVSCGRDRQLSDQPRPSYDPLSGFDPGYLLHAPEFDPGKVNTEADQRVAELEAKVNRLVAALESKDADADGGKGGT